MWVTSSGLLRDTLWSNRSAGMKWWTFLNWLLQSQQSSNHRFLCEQWWTFPSTIPSATVMYNKRCNMGFLIQRTLPSKLQWDLLIFNSSFSRTWEIKAWEHKPCKDWIQNAGTFTDVTIWSSQSNGYPQKFTPLHTEREQTVFVAGFSACHRSENTDSGVNSKKWERSE